MLERLASKKDEQNKNAEEYSETVERINDSLRSLFSTVKQPKGWMSAETETPDGYTIVRGYDFEKQEGTLIIEKDDEHLEETITYSFDVTEKRIKREGFRHRKNYGGKVKPVYFTDDMKTMDEVEKVKPTCTFAPALLVQLDELKIIERIVVDPVLNGIFATLPSLRLPSASFHLR